MPLIAITGSYTNDDSSSPKIYTVDDFGNLAATTIFGEVPQPSHLTQCLANKTIYAVSEMGSPGAIVALQIRDASLVEIDRVPSFGSFPCFVECDNKHVYAANYGSGDLVRYEIRPDGTFGPNTWHLTLSGDGPHARQDSSHPHCAVLGPEGSRLYVCDLGTDELLVFDNEGRSGARQLNVDQVVQMESGSGPRHLVFHPADPVLFVVCELSNTLDVLIADSHSNSLTRHQSVSVFPKESSTPNLAAAIRVHPSGERVYVSNRGDDSVSTFRYDKSSKRCELIETTPCGGSDPRDFVLDPSGSWILVANQSSNTISRLELDPQTLVPHNPHVVAELSSPTCIILQESPS